MASGSRICVIDLGTNSFHAVIVDAHPDHTFTVVDKLKEPVHLGDTGLATRMLTSDGVSRAETALRRIQTLADRRAATEIIAYATSAIREAENGEEFVRHIRSTLGIDIRPIAGEHEARLIYKGVRRVVDLDEPALIVDIGGGSTELVIADTEEVHYAESFKLGAARMTDQFFSSDPPGDDEIAELRAHIGESLEPVYAECKERGVTLLVGSSGTMENLVAMALEQSDRSGALDQHEFGTDEISDVTADVLEADRGERTKISALDRRRVDQIAAGAVLVQELIENASIERVCISQAALREGMVEAYLESHADLIREIGDEADVMLRRARELALHHSRDPDHAWRVTDMACELFDQLAPLHELDNRSRRMLEAAAIVHDIGHTISGRKHHKHSRYIIEQSGWPGVEPDDVAIIACVARYHRRAVPKKKHKRYRKLDKRDRRRVQALSAILRLADKLDRSHIGNTESLRAGITADAVHVTIQTRSDPELELSAGRRAVAAFARAFDRRLELHAAWRPAAVRERAAS